MSALPRRHRHLQIFAVCLLVLLAALAVFLFGVKIEQIATGDGVVTTQQIVELRANEAGTIRYSGQLGLEGEPGSVLAGDAAFAFLDPGGGRELVPLSPSWPAYLPNHKPTFAVRERYVASGASVERTELLLDLVEINPTHQGLVDPRIRADFDERQFGSLQVGQEVRIESTMYPANVHGYAEGWVDRLLPIASQTARGKKFAAEIRVKTFPFPFKYGATVKVEVVLGRKMTYQVILEK